MSIEAKPIYRSRTVFSAILLVIGYFTAKSLEAGDQWVQGIIIVGIALIAIFMRSGLISLMDTPMEDMDGRRLRPAKSIFASKTVLVTAAVVAGFFVARRLELPGKYIEGGMVVGIALIAIFMRAGMIPKPDPKPAGAPSAKDGDEVVGI